MRKVNIELINICISSIIKITASALAAVLSGRSTVVSVTVTFIPIEMAGQMGAPIFNDQRLQQRRAALSSEIVQLWEEVQGALLYGLLCPNGPDCPCISEDEVPRLRISRCYIPGELDYFTVTQPFQQHYGFQVTWHCHVCLSQYSCGDGGLRSMSRVAG